MTALLAGLVLGQLVGIAQGGEATTLSINDRTETRVHSSQYVPPFAGVVNSNSTAFDVDNTLSAVLVTGRHHTSYVLAYSPRLSYLDVTGARQLSLIHSARSSASYWTRRLRLTFTLDGTVGSQSAIGLLTPANFETPTQPATAPAGATPGTSSSAPTTPTAPPVQVAQPTPTFVPLAQVLIITTASGRAGVAGAYAFSHRLKGAASASYSAAAGLDYYSQVVSPPSRGPSADTSLSYALTHRDQLATAVNGSYVTVVATPRPNLPTGPNRNYLIGGALESYHHVWTRWTSTDVGVGVNFLATSGPSDEDRGVASGVFAAGQATIVHVEPRGRANRLEYRGNVATGIVFNQALGAAQNQVSATASVTWIHERLSALLAAGAATTLPVDAADSARTFNGSATLGYAPAPAVLLQTGVRLYTQVFAPALAAATVVNSPLQWDTFLAVTVFAPKLAF